MIKNPLHYLPIGRYSEDINARGLRADAMAGFTNAAIVLPQGVAFATIAGLPPVYGLYSAMVIPIIAALFGSSRVMISGPTTAISAVLLTAVLARAEIGTANYINVALTLTILVGLFQLIFGLARLGALISFVSHSVIIGFTAAAAVLIAVSQLGSALGVDVERGGTIVERLFNVYDVIGGTNVVAIMIAATSLIVAIVVRMINPVLPNFLLSLAAGALVGWMLNAGENGVMMVGELPSIVPMFSAPEIDLTLISQLAPNAIAIALIGLLEALSIGRAFALRHEDRYDANQEIIGQGLSNVIGGFFQSYAGSGSFTRSGVNHEAGARTPISAIFASLFLFLMVLLIAPLFSQIPMPAIAGIILYVAWRLIDFHEIRHIFDSSRSDSVVLIITFLAGLLIELDFAIYMGVIVSLAGFLHKTAHPDLIVGAPGEIDGERKIRNAELLELPECPQILLLRLDGPLYFGSVEHVENAMRRMEVERPNQKHILFILKGVGDVDLSGGDLLIAEARRIAKRGGSLSLITAYQPLVRSLNRMHVLEHLGEESLFGTKGLAIRKTIKQLDMDICAHCRFRVFDECSKLPNLHASRQQNPPTE